LVLGLLFALLAEKLGLHFILGAFLAGLFFTKRTLGSDVHKDVRKKTNAVTTGFLAPLFFASIGMHLNISAITEVPLFVVVLIGLAVVTKFVGAGIPARLLGLSREAAMGVGVGMSARGAVELIIADIALRAGLFNQPEPPPPLVANLFSATVIMAVATTILMPLGLRVLLGRRQSAARGR
jgi:Kef-type K+ transport system membrane component KefB